MYLTDQERKKETGDKAAPLLRHPGWQPPLYGMATPPLTIASHPAHQPRPRTSIVPRTRGTSSYGCWYVGGVDVWDEAVAVRPGLGGSYGSPLPPGRLRPSRGGQLRPTGDVARPTPIPWQVGSLRVALRAYTTNPIVRNPSPGTEESPQKKRDQNRDRF